MKTESQIRERISNLEQNIRDMNTRLITAYHPKLGKLQLAHQRELAIQIRTLYEDALNEKVIGIARAILSP